MRVWKWIGLYCSQQPRASKYLLPLSWLGGMLLGFSFALLAKDVLLQQFFGILYAQTTFVSILLASVFPYLLCALFYWLEQDWMIYFICFFKSACFMYCALAVGVACGSAAWLVRVLFLFTDCCTIPVLYYYCSCLIRADDSLGKLLHWGVHIYACMIPVADYCIVSPFFLSVLLS